MKVLLAIMSIVVFNGMLVAVVVGGAVNAMKVGGEGEEQQA